MSQTGLGGAIRTPDQRLRVFVSSTLAELAEERAVVSRAISSLRLTPVLFELGARPHPPRELYRAYLSQSDIFIGIYWQRYGWVGPGMDISGLEDELQLSEGMPRLLYVKTPAPQREEGLARMIERLQTEATSSYRSFRSPRELGRLVREDLAILLSERFAGHSDLPVAATGEAARQAVASRTLPSPSTSLVGREEDIEQVVQLLQTPDVRLVTLTGLGGVGKTRLAVAVAERLKEDYPATPVFVPLASVSEVALVLPRIAAAVGASLEGTDRPLDALAEHLGESPVLLVLDNLEQVVDAGPDLEELLTRCPAVKILATSRSVLRLRAEHEYPVNALAVPSFSAAPGPEQVTSLPAVQLFVERARAVRRDFALNGDNAAAVAEICRRLDGLPLGIELAAARTRLLDPPTLLDRLGSRLDVPGTGPVDLPERHRTLRRTIEWSVNLLGEAEREMLATLAAFVDGWTLEAAASVSGLDEDRTLDLLDALAGHSLVDIAAGNAGPRFRMLGTVREFAAELLDASPDSPAVEQRHAAYFRELAQNTVWPLPNEATWADRLHAEEGNLRRTIQWCFANDIAALPHLFRLLWRFWMLRDRMAEGRAWVDELRARESSLDDVGRAELWLTSATAASEIGDDDGAAAAAGQLKLLQARIDDRNLQSAMQIALSWVLPAAGDMDGANAAASASLQGFREQDEPMMAINAVFTLGLQEMATGDFDAAHQHLSEVHASRGQFGDHWLASVACAQLGWLAAEAGRLDEAHALLDESVQSLETERSTRMLSFCLVAYAQVALTGGEPQQAAQALGAVEGLRTRTGLRPWPLVRPGEARVLAGVREALPTQAFQAAFDAGSQLSRQDAVAMLRGNAAA